MATYALDRDMNGEKSNEENDEIYRKIMKKPYLYSILGQEMRSIVEKIMLDVDDDQLLIVVLGLLHDVLSWIISDSADNILWFLY